MHRGQRDTRRWLVRLGPALAASLALHLAVLAAPVSVTRPDIPVSFTDTVEFGLETPTPGAPEAPAASTQTPPETPPAPAAPPPRPPRAPRPPRPPRPAAPPRPPPEAHAPPEAPDPTQGTVGPDDTGDDAEDAGVALAANDPDGGDPSAVASADAGPAFVPIVGVARAAGALAPAIPAGSVVTLLLRTDRLRDNPNAPAVRSLLASIPDWRSLLGVTELDPLQDFNSILLATPNPFVRMGQTPDVMALVRTRVPRGFLRASVEQMAGARDPHDPDAGTLRSRFDPDASAPLARPSRPVWTRQGAAEVTTVDRYIGPLAVVLLADDLAAIAPAARVPALLAVLGARNGPFQRPGATGGSGAGSGRAGRLVTALEARNVRTLVRAQGALANAVPTRVDLAVYETRPGGAPDGGAQLAVALAYDSPAQAAAAARLLAALLEDSHELIDQQTRDPRIRLGAMALGVRFDTLHETLRALRATPDNDTVRLEADLNPEQVRQLLHLQRLAGLLR